MHHTSYAPTRCHERGCNVCEDDFPCRPLNVDAKNGEESPFSSFNMNRNLDFDKVVLSQIIQKHEATFRYQLQELHRLYRKQRELMDEIGGASHIYKQHLQFQTPESSKPLTQAHSRISQTTSHTASWNIGNNSDNLSLITAKDIQGRNFTAGDFQNSIISDHGLFPTKHKYDEAKSISSRRECHGTRISNLQLPDDVYLDSYECPAQGSLHDHVKEGDFSNSGIKQGNRNFSIDLNEPLLFEPMESGSTTSFEPYVTRKEVTCNSLVVYRVDELNSVASEQACVNNLTVGIDLNLTPLSSEENSLKSDEESKVEDSHDYLLPSRTKQDRSTRVPSSSKNEQSFDSCVGSNSSSAHDHPTSKGMLGEDPTSDTNISTMSLKTKTHAVMNTSIVLEETFPSLSSTKAAMESAEEIDLEAPVSPGNKKGSPPRGKSEDAVVEASPPLSEQGKREPEIELDAVAAETLIFMSFSGALDINLSNCLYWFSDIVSSTCGVNDLENRVMKPIKIKKRKHSQKNNESARDYASNDLPRRNAGRNSFSKPRNLKSLCLDDKKSVTSILKDLRAVSCGWGRMKKRQGGHRRRASKFRTE